MICDGGWDYAALRRINRILGDKGRKRDVLADVIE